VFVNIKDGIKAQNVLQRLAGSNWNN
jgi:hypothetical protein